VSPADIDSLASRRAKIAHRHPSWQLWEIELAALQQIGVEIVASAPSCDRRASRPRLRFVDGGTR
jgi:hypothetical protein